MYNDSVSSDNFSRDANFFKYMVSPSKFKINSTSINNEDIFSEFSRLNDDYSYGSDGIPLALYGQCVAHHFVEIFLHITEF